MNYYNEFDPHAAAWLRQLIADGLIPDGIVDERSIEDVRPDELVGYTQCHFFAGIGGWPLALRLAGWPDDRPVWTGSCPCQPFSGAGKRGGVDDPRHLWPAFRWLIDQCRPAKVFGEQVASKAGRAWWAGVQTDLEAMGYGAAAADLCGASIGAPHIRQRLFWVGHAQQQGLEGHAGHGDDRHEPGRLAADVGGSVAQAGSDCGLADTNRHGCQTRDAVQPAGPEHDAEYGGGAGGVADTHDRQRERESDGEGCQHNGAATGWQQGDRGAPSSSSGSPWAGVIWIGCADGKARRIEPGISKMAYGISCTMVCGCDESAPKNEKEVDHAQKAKGDPGQGLSELREKAGEKAFLGKAGGYDPVSSPEVLQQKLHGGGLRGSDEDAHSRECAPAVQESREKFLRGVWVSKFSACSSCGRESYEQLAIQFDDVVRSMSPRSSFTEFFGPRGAEELLALLKASDEERALLDSQYPFQKVWRSLADQDKERLRLAFDQGSWQLIEGLKPLVDGIPRGVVPSSDPGAPGYAENTAEARKMRLSGYGNAIIPALAAEFIIAAQETVL